MLPSDLFPRRHLSRSARWQSCQRKALDHVANAEAHDNAALAVYEVTKALREILILLNDIIERERILEQAENAINGGNA